ncbi:hypothetical protein HC891_18765 [Candidatus Gracilibacteria bacterium]|nr:hypothetical protein [Candidatus Gracilibacteria bacterium]
MTRKGDSVIVNFENVFGTPKEIQWSWGSPVSDSDNDSNGWQPYANPLTIPLTPELREDAPCTPVTLYTRVRNTEVGKIESFAKSDAITIDARVEAQYRIRSPYAVDDEIELNDIAALAGATLNDFSGGRGDPNYTRLPAFHLSLDGSDDCSGVASFTVAKAGSTISSTKALADDRFDDFVLFPDFIDAKDGLNRFTVTVRDGAGNELPVAFSLVLDTSDPVLDLTSPGTITVTDRSPSDSLLVDIDLTDINLTDAELPGVTTSSGRQFWGVWIAVSRTEVANPANNSALEWIEYETPGDSSSVRVPEFSLASGLDDAEVTPGDYYIYVRFLDRAGNPTDDALSFTYTLVNVDEPEIFLPIVRR